MEDNDTQDKFIARYAEGDVPWDDDLPPPEVVTLAAQLAPGRALDLGCGYGRTAIYLARLGWQVDGVDFVPQAVAGAAARAAAAGVADRARFHAHSVTDLAFLSPGYDFAVDVGCMHALSLEQIRAYLGELARLLRPGGHFLLFVRLDDEESDEPEGPPTINEQALRRLLTADFVIDKINVGQTDMADDSWRSAWIWLQAAAGG